MQKELSWKTCKQEEIKGFSWKPKGIVNASLILIHGLGEHSQRYNHVIEFFNKNNISVYALDLIGHGQSAGKRGHADSYDMIASDILHLISIARSENKNVPIFLYGHSLGGALALYIALKMKPEIAGYIVTSPGLIPANPPQGFRLFLAKTMNILGPSFTLDNKLYRPGLSRDEKVVEAYNADPLVHPMISARLGMQLLNNGNWMIDHASELSSPTLLMQGSADKLVDPNGSRQFSEKAPRKYLTYKEWNGFYHELHNEPEKGRVLDFILGWIRNNY